MFPVEAIKIRENFILECIALTGDFPISLLVSFPGSYDWTLKCIRKLKKENLIRIYEKDDCKSLRLTKKGKELLLHAFPERFYFLSNAKWQSRACPSKITARYRSHLLGKTYLFLRSLGVELFTDEKRSLASLPYVKFFSNPAFYSSLEIKSYGDSPLKIRAARSSGLLLAPEKKGFLLYQSTGEIMRWSEASERKLKGYASALSGNIPLSGIILAPNDLLLSLYLNSNGSKKDGYFLLTDLFPSFHFVPEHDQGLQLFSMICQKDFYEKMKIIYLKEVKQNGFNTIPTADGWIGNRPVLLAWDLDMVKLQGFKISLLQKQLKGVLLCFQWQKNSLADYFQETVDIRIISPQ